MSHTHHTAIETSMAISRASFTAITTRPRHSTINPFATPQTPAPAPAPPSTHQIEATPIDPSTLSQEDQCCSICCTTFGEAQDNEEATSERALQTACGHIFGEACLVTWLTDTNTCPNCRHELYEKEVEEWENSDDFGDGGDSGYDSGYGSADEAVRELYESEREVDAGVVIEERDHAVLGHVFEYDDEESEDEDEDEESDVEPSLVPRQRGGMVFHDLCPVQEEILAHVRYQEENEGDGARLMY